MTIGFHKVTTTYSVLADEQNSGQERQNGTKNPISGNGSGVPDLKTWFEGTHHGVNKKHMQAYLNEFVFSHNRRRTHMAAVQTVLGLATRTKGPTYAELYSAGPSATWNHPNS
jgi:hypothetical protein